MHDVLSSIRKKPIDIQVLDFKQCFDALWLEEGLNDMYEVEENMLSLLYEAGRYVNIAVQNPSGISNPKEHRQNFHARGCVLIINVQ